MKKALFLALIFFICSYYGCDKEKMEDKSVKLSEANDSTINITKLQSFLTKHGILIVKDFYSLGNIDGLYSSKMTFDAVVFYEPGKENDRIRGLRIEVSESRSYGQNQETVFLDMEELESFSSALKYMITLKNKWNSTKKEYTEVFFETKGRFKAGFYQQEIKVTPFASAGYGNSINCFLSDTKQLTDIKERIDSGIKLLHEK